MSTITQKLASALRAAYDRLGVLIECDNEDHGGASKEDVDAWAGAQDALGEFDAQPDSQPSQEATRLASALTVLRKIAAIKCQSDEGQEDMSDDDLLNNLHEAVQMARSEVDQHEAGNGLIPVLLDGQEHATIIAALRFYQEEEMTDPDNRSDDIHDLATNGDQEVSMDDEGVDALCEKLNFAAAA